MVLTDYQIKIINEIDKLSKKESKLFLTFKK